VSYGPFDVPQSNELEGSTTLTIVGAVAVIKIARGRGAEPDSGQSRSDGVDPQRDGVSADVVRLAAADRSPCAYGSPRAYGSRRAHGSSRDHSRVCVRGRVCAASAPPPVVRPTTLGGKPRIETGIDSGAADDLTFQVAATAQGVYGNAATQDVLFLVAVASTDMTPEARFSLMVSEASKEFGVDSYISVDPGSLGGLAKCGNGTINGVPAAVCAWSDNGTTGLLVNSLQEADALGRQVASLRTEVEKTSMS
jgi:hypothetical protein